MHRRTHIPPRQAGGGRPWPVPPYASYIKVWFSARIPKKELALE